MPIVLDHVFVCCSADGTEARSLMSLGLKEGSSKVHSGQGTANRRFFFENAYLELFWVSDAEEARREPISRTRLWERWSKRREGACPFGLVFANTAGSAGQDPPFPTWSYRPPYSPVAIDIGLGTPLTEPELFFFRFPRPADALRAEPRAHALPLANVTAVTVGLPGPSARSAPLRAVEAAGLVSFPVADEYLMTLAFDGETRSEAVDLRPELPLGLSW